MLTTVAECDGHSIKTTAKSHMFSEGKLLTVRKVFLSLAFLHLAFTALVTLAIDTTVDEDPKIRAYYYIRWKLITCWFNLITLAYLPARLYVDWRTGRGEGHQGHVKTLGHATDVLMTGVVFPTTVFSDVMFWIIYLTNPDLMAPVHLFNYLPMWSQHSLHTVSGLVVVIDLLLTPRRRPTSLRNRRMLMISFLLVYSSVICHSLWKGEFVYAFMEHTGVVQRALLLAVSLAMYLIIFHVQWYAIDRLWKNATKHNSIACKKIT